MSRKNPVRNVRWRHGNAELWLTSPGILRGSFEHLGGGEGGGGQHRWLTFSLTARAAVTRSSREAEEDKDALVLPLTSDFFLGALIHEAHFPFWESGPAFPCFLSSVELLAEVVRQVGTSGPAVGSLISCF